MNKEKIYSLIVELENTIKELMNEIEHNKLKKLCFIDEKGNITPLFSEYVEKDKIRKFIKEELPDDEIMECCEMYDVNGIRLRKELEKIIKGEITNE